MVGGKVDSWGSVTHSQDGYDDAEFDPEALITEMALDGWQARWAAVAPLVVGGGGLECPLIGVEIKPGVIRAVRAVSIHACGSNDRR